MDHLRQFWPTLDSLKNKFLFSSLAQNSINTYRSGVKQYIQFCRLLNFPPLPLNELVLENFVTSLCGKVGVKAMRVYLYGIQYWATLEGSDSNIANMVRLPYVLRGIRRWQGKSHSRPERHPITIPLLESILSYIDRNYILGDRLMYRAAVLTAFFGMLRVSEYTAPSKTRFDYTTHLISTDVTFSNNFNVMSINIKASKTDPFRLGIKVRIGSTHNHLCPVLAMTNYLASRPRICGPLFMLRDTSYLTRTNVQNLLRNSLPFVENVSSHSFRRGGASFLNQAGLPHELIQIFGRWKSEAYKLYISLPDSFIHDISKMISLHTLHTS